MTKRKRCAALALALTLTISMFGCEKDKETTQSSAVSQIKTSDSAQPSNVKVKDADPRYPIVIMGVDSSHVENVSIKNIEVEYRGGIQISGVSE